MPIVDTGPKDKGGGKQQPNKPDGSTDTSKNPGTTTTDGGGGKDPYAAAVAREKDYRSRAADRYVEQAQTLQQQAKALRIALGKKGMRAAMQQKLQNLNEVYRDADRILMKGYKRQVEGLEGSADDNTKALAAQTQANLSNAGRERANALSEAMLQGAGESDVLRSQGMALRNWSANQQEVNRAFVDTNTSIDNALTDLNVNTQSARANLQIDRNADREMLWTSYYDQRSETLTQLGNTTGQMADYYSLANEQEKSKKNRGKADDLQDKSGNYFDRAAKLTGKAYENPGVSKKIMRWDGRNPVTSELNPKALGRRPQDTSLDRPEGASLREWTP